MAVEIESIVRAWANVVETAAPGVYEWTGQGLQGVQRIGAGTFKAMEEPGFININVFRQSMAMAFPSLSSGGLPVWCQSIVTNSGVPGYDIVFKHDDGVAAPVNTDPASFYFLLTYFTGEIIPAGTVL